MTNEQIIFEEVNNKYHTAEQRRAILALAYTPEQLNAKCAGMRFENMTEEQQRVQAEKVLLADLFHTFHEWKRQGKSVKAGEKAAIDTRLWKMDDRPRKTSASMEPDALTAAANDQRPDGNYYKAPAHLFHIGQVEASRPAPAGRFKSLDEIKAYNRMLADQRKAAKAAAEQAASAPAEIPAKAETPAQPATKPAKKASKPAAPKAATKPAAKPSAPQKAAQPAPDALHKAERKACAAFLAVPETDRKGQAAALDAWRKARKAEEDAKTAASAPAVVPAPVEIAPVQQLDFESIAAGLLA